MRSFIVTMVQGGSSRGVHGVYGENTWPFLRKKHTLSSRNRSGIGFMSSRIAGNDRLGLGSSKIEVLAKNSKENRENL